MKQVYLITTIDTENNSIQNIVASNIETAESIFNRWVNNIKKYDERIWTWTTRFDEPDEFYLVNGKNYIKISINKIVYLENDEEQI